MPMQLAETSGSGCTWVYGLWVYAGVAENPAAQRCGLKNNHMQASHGVLTAGFVKI